MSRGVYHFPHEAVRNVAVRGMSKEKHGRSVTNSRARSHGYYLHVTPHAPPSTREHSRARPHGRGGGLFCYRSSVEVMSRHICRGGGYYHSSSQEDLIRTQNTPPNNFARAMYATNACLRCGSPRTNTLLLVKPSH